MNASMVRSIMTRAKRWYERGSRSPAIIRRFMRSVALLSRQDEFLLCFYLSKGRVGQNWGDKLNPVLVSMISGRTVLNANDFFNLTDMPIYSVVGSGLGEIRHSNSVIWGQGFARYDDGVCVPPRQVCAVRGPLSRQKLLNAGLHCLPIFGDPALLLPRYFNDYVEKRHRIGLIPHYSHLGLTEFERLQDQGAVVIDITGELFDVVRAVKSCYLIASSSLHGMIMADAYGVPSRWLEVEGHPIADEFRFHDYLHSVGRTDLTAFVVDKTSRLSDIEASLVSYRVEIDLERLYESCPFKKPDVASGSGTARELVAAPPTRAHASYSQRIRAAIHG